MMSGPIIQSCDYFAMVYYAHFRNPTGFLYSYNFEAKRWLCTVKIEAYYFCLLIEMWEIGPSISGVSLFLPLHFSQPCHMVWLTSHLLNDGSRTFLLLLCKETMSMLWEKPWALLVSGETQGHLLSLVPGDWLQTAVSIRMTQS
jgi:hypothetical protein